MNNEYSVKKQTITLNDVEGANVFFANGEFFGVAKREIIDMKVEYYDKLIKGKRAYCPVAKSGYLKLRLDAKRPHLELADVAVAKSDRRGYLMRRCIEEVGASYFTFYDDCNWEKCFYASAVASIDGDYLIYTFLENPTMGAADSDTHSLTVAAHDKESIFKLELDFENCDGIEVFDDEIVEINLVYNTELDYHPSYCFCREIVGGYLRLRFNPDYCQYKKSTVYCGSKKPTLKNLEARICGKGTDEIDICHLYVDHLMPSYSAEFNECLSVPNLYESPYSEEECGEDDEDLYDRFASGYAKREEDGTILIVFGKLLEDAENA